jgi:hypothetical protein
VDLERKLAPAPTTPTTASNLPEGFAGFIMDLATPTTKDRGHAAKLGTIASGEEWPSRVLATSTPKNQHFAQFVKEFQTELIQRYKQDQARADYKAEQSANMDDIFRRARAGEFTTTYMDNFGTIRQRDNGFSIATGAFARNVFTNVFTSMLDPGGTEGFTSQLITSRFLELKKVLPKIYPPSPECTKLVDFIITKSAFGHSID